MSNKSTIFFFFPLASIGGTETVHADILGALREYRSYTYIRYKSNVWKGREYSNSPHALAEGRAMVSEFSKHTKLHFLSSFLEAPRFGRIIRKIYTKRLAKKINRSINPVVIFWHRESIEFLWPYLKPHVKIIDIVHNNSNNEYPDANYLVNDWVPRINRRVLVSEGLKKWLLPLYEGASYPDEFKSRLSVIHHMVQFPAEGYIKKSTAQLNVLFVGRDSIEKRFHLILEIAQILEHTDPGIKFHFVGPETVEYHTQSRSNMIWHGEITDRSKLNSLYKIAHIVILTSSSEGFPKVIAEGMANSCVPLTTAVGGIPDALSNGFNALFTETTECVEQTIVHLQSIMNNKEHFRTLSKNAYIYAREHFAHDRFENEWKRIISTTG